jgi:GntR family transcriptional regulator
MLRKGSFDFYLDRRSGVPVYTQVVQQVKGALRLGLLGPGDQLPTVMETVERLVVSPNTVLKAYRQLELERLVVTRPALGTFIAKTIDLHLPTIPPSIARAVEKLYRDARAAGVDDDAFDALIEAARRRARSSSEGVA